MTEAGQLQLWPIASNDSKLTPTWPENLFWTASYPVKPGELGRGRAEVPAPGPNIISLARTFHLSGIILISESSLVMVLSTAKEIVGPGRELNLGPLLLCES